MGSYCPSAKMQRMAVLLVITLKPRGKTHQARSRVQVADDHSRCTLDGLFIVSALILEKMTLTQGPLIGTRVPHGGYEQEIWGHMMYNCVGGKAVDTTFRPLNSWNARFGDVPADRLALLKKFWNNDGDRYGYCRRS